MNRPMRETFLGVDIGATKTVVALCTSEGEVKNPLRVDRPEGEEARWILESILHRIEEIRRTSPEEWREVRRCGVGFGGPVRDNRPVRSVHVPGWEEIDLAAEIERRFGLPTRMKNDCLVQALGEFAYGAGKGRRSMVFINLGSGVGGGIVLEGRLLEGDGYAGHFGHVCVVPGGRLCPCGNRGCLEAYCSGRSIGARAREAAAAGGAESRTLAGRISQLDPHAGAAPALFELARAGDPLSRRLVDETLDRLALALSAGLNVLDVRTYVIGGGAGLGLASWLGDLREGVAEKSMWLCREGLEILPAKLGEHSLLLGTTALWEEGAGRHEPSETNRPVR